MADLLPGTSDSILAENVRTLRKQGLSEAAALARARMHAKGADESEGSEAAEPADVGSEESDSTDRQFVVATKDFSGLGWAKKLMEEGETVTVAHTNDETKPEQKKNHDLVGHGWLSVMTLDEAMKKLQTPQTYWIFAANDYPEEADILRKKGQKVFGTSALSEKLEHDRNYAVQIAEEAGLDSPPTHEFSTREEGLSFLDENPDKAYVFKPDDGKFNYMTFVPARKEDADANRELYIYLEHMKQDPGAYILQERIAIEDALEVNAEVWMYEGEPFLATVGLEVKRKNTYDIGEMCGCAGDFTQFIPLDSELVKQTIGKLLPFYKEQKYTGFADVNVIFTKDGVPHFLEVCNRFGYNSHPNMFLALALDGFGNIIVDFTDGNVEGMADRFRKDVGCSMTLFTDHPREGLPIHIDDRYREQFYPFDGHMDGGDDTLLMTGYSDEIGIFFDHAETLEAAADKVWDKIVFQEAVSFPDMYYRSDLGKEDYYNAPVLRYKELKKRGLL